MKQFARRGERVRRRDHLVARRDARPRRRAGAGPRCPTRRRPRTARRPSRRTPPRSGRSSARARAGPSAAPRARAPRRARRCTAPRAGPAVTCLLHACVFAAGAYSSHCDQRSLRPCTVSRYASWISTRHGPGPADHVVVDLADRRHLGGGADHEHLVGEIEVGADQRLLDDACGRDPARSGSPCRA